MTKLKFLFALFAANAFASSPFIVGNLIDNGLSASQAVVTDSNKQLASVARGDLTDAGTDGIVVTSGASAVFGAGTSLAQHVADATHNGYLLQTDWSTFNGKQAAGNYITALTGDVTASGPGSVAAAVAKIQGTTVSGTTGTTNVVFSSAPTLSNPVVGTQSQADNSTKAASTAYVDTAIAGKVSTTLTNTHILVGNGSSVATDVAASGDASLANTGAFTIGKVNGVAYPASPGTNTVPVVTSSNTITYETVPVAAGGTGLATLTSHALYVGAGTSVPTAISVGTTNQVLHANTSADPSFSALTVADMTIANHAQSTCTTASTIDWSLSNQFTILLTNGDACAVTFSNAVSGQEIMIDLTQAASGGGTATVTWASSPKWPAGTTPTITTGNAATDSITCKYNGTDYRCVAVQNFQ